MATVRIYKVAELLGTTSQEVTALLKRDHGIEVKSASSTIEEVVARQFVDRLAKQRNITLPTGDIFSETPVQKGGGFKKPALAKKAPEPQKPLAPPLPPPRLVKTSKPVHAPGMEHHEEHGHDLPGHHEQPHQAGPHHVEAHAHEPVHDQEHEHEPAAHHQAAHAPVEAAPEPEPVVHVEPEPVHVAPHVEEPNVVPEMLAAPPAEAAPVAATPEPVAIEPAPAPVVEPPAAPRAAAPAPAPVAPRPVGRIVPPKNRLRIEDTPPPMTPPLSPNPVSRVMPRPVIVRPPAPAATPPRPAGSTQPGAPGARPGMPGQRPPMGGSRSSGPRRDNRPSAPSAPAAPPPVTRTITLAEGMTVKDLADKLDVRVKDVLAKLLMKRLMMTINSTLDTETASMLAREFGADVQMRSFEEELIQVDAGTANAADIITRAPVVTVMGHVDHGKTSLLDAIREARVAEREAGGITQHIGAYHVTINGKNIVFLDTPGHEAFTLMRARGAKVTDVVILVVAADDGVMPQTREAIDHAKAANVPIIVAINKIDKPGANPERVKRELTELDLMPEEWGGKTVTVEVSAKKKTNIDSLLEMILLVSEIGELKANPKRSASGTVLEAKLDKGRGPVATVLVQDGTLSVGDTFIAGPIVGRVRALIDDRGRPTKSAGPSTPVEVLGLTGLPQPGDIFQVAEAAKARQIAAFREEQAKNRALGAKGGRLTLESLQAQIAEGGMKELPIIIKADVQGSAEVLADTLAKLSDDKVKIRIIHSGVGAVTESDVLLGTASKAIIIAFNVRPDRNAEQVASREGVDIRLHSIIYNVTDEMKKAMVGLLEPTFKEVRIGVAQVRDIFKVPKFGTIAGCMVMEGRITRSGDTQARLLRENVVVFEGKIGSLRRFKDDVGEVKTGFECGIGFDKYNDLRVGDVIEVFQMERIAVTA